MLKRILAFVLPLASMLMRTKPVSMLAAVAILIAVFSFSACKKNEEPGEPSAGEVYFTTKLNGTKIDFGARVSAQISSDKKHIVVGGQVADQAISDGYDFGLHSDGQAIMAKTYVLAETDMITRYYVQNYENDEWTSTTVFNAIGPTQYTEPGTSFTLTITSIDNWGIKGTFEGRIKLLAGNQYIDIAEGRFSAPFVPSE